MNQPRERAKGQMRKGMAERVHGGTFHAKFGHKRWTTMTTEVRIGAWLQRWEFPHRCLYLDRANRHSLLRRAQQEDGG